MRIVRIPEVIVPGAHTLESAADKVLGLDTLRRVHGPGVSVTPFVDGRRTVRFGVRVVGVPRVLHRFLCGADELAVTADQVLAKDGRTWTLTNHIKMHCLGANLFRIQPRFVLSAREEGVSVGGSVRHDASLPFPLNRLAESCMARHSERELRRFAQALSVE